MNLKKTTFDKWVNKPGKRQAYLEGDLNKPFAEPLHVTANLETNDDGYVMALAVYLPSGEAQYFVAKEES